MASGRKDYWYAMLPGLPNLGAGQSDWYMAQDPEIEAGATVRLLEYTVLTGYTLHIMGGMVTCASPGINRMRIDHNGVLIAVFYFDTILVFPQQPVGFDVFIPGDVIEVYITNNDSITNQFYCILTGFEIYKL